MSLSTFLHGVPMITHVFFYILLASEEVKRCESKMTQILLQYEHLGKENKVRLARAIS